MISVTAQRVAAQRLRFERIPAPWGDPEADERLARDVAGPGPLTPSRLEGYLRVRTAFFDRVVVDNPTHQVVAIGAGYDGRSLRYAKEGVRWWEVDYPDTQADKRARLERLGIAADHVTFVAHDLREPGVDAALRRAGVEVRFPTLILCEGVAVYLETTVLERVLRELHSIGTRLAISLSTSASDQRRRGFRAAVAALGEPALSGPEAHALLRSTGWRGGADGAGLVVADRA